MQRITLLLVVLMVLMAGCSTPAVPEAQQEVKAAETALCVSVKAYAASVEALSKVTPETTVAELNTLKDAVAKTYEAMVGSWAELQESEVQVVESAVAAFNDVLKQTPPGDATLGEVANTIQASAATVKAAVDQLSQTACAAPE